MWGAGLYDEGEGRGLIESFGLPPGRFLLTKVGYALALFAVPGVPLALLFLARTPAYGPLIVWALLGGAVLLVMAILAKYAFYEEGERHALRHTLLLALTLGCILFLPLAPTLLAAGGWLARRAPAGASEAVFAAQASVDANPSSSIVQGFQPRPSSLEKSSEYRRSWPGRSVTWRTSEGSAPVSSTMRWVSTRGQSPPVPFIDALFAGTAPDGGLYIGDTPPEGSTYLGEAGKLGTVGDGLGEETALSSVLSSLLPPSLVPSLAEVPSQELEALRERAVKSGFVR